MIAAEAVELREAGEILLTLRQSAPKRPRDSLARSASPPEQNRVSAVAPWIHTIHHRPIRSTDAQSGPSMGYSFSYFPYPEAGGAPLPMFKEEEHPCFRTMPSREPIGQGISIPMVAHPHGMHFRVHQPHYQLLPTAVDSESRIMCTNILVHRILCKQLSKALAEKLGYGSIQPFQPTEAEYGIVFQGIRTMYFSKNKKAAWRTTYRHFLDTIGVKTRKFPPSWWCVSNKDITPEQREKCMRLLLTIGVEMLVLLDECGHAPFPFSEEVDANRLQRMGLSIRDDMSYWQFWEKDWRDLAPDVKFESAASMWYLATFNRSMSFLGDGVLKFMTFLIVRRCDFFRVHTGKHAQGKVAKRYIMSSNSMSNSYARLMSIQLLDHTLRPRIPSDPLQEPAAYAMAAAPTTASVVAVETSASPLYQPVSPLSSPPTDEEYSSSQDGHDVQPEPKRTRID